MRHSAFRRGGGGGIKPFRGEEGMGLSPSEGRRGWTKPFRGEEGVD